VSLARAVSDDRAAWSGLVGAVTTPLGFFTLIALILDGVLIAGALATVRISLWAPLAVLAFLVALVFVLLVLRPEVLRPARPMVVSLVFPLEPIEVDLDPDRFAQVGHPPPLTGGHPPIAGDTEPCPTPR
jgi:hypothetical protein